MVERIYLIGFMGTGKTTIGQQLAERLQYQFYDTDQLIVERAEMSIPQIFEQKGEAAFRDLEMAVLQDVESNLRHAVLATGGGIVLREENRFLLYNQDDHKLVVHLRADIDTLVQRLQHDRSRPLLRGEDVKSRMEQLQLERAGLYDFADLTIQTDGITPHEIVNRIVLELV